MLEKYHPNPLEVKEVYIKQRMPYEELYQHKAAVMFPYDTSLMMFWEFYSANMPIFLPHKRFWLYSWIFGQHTRHDL